MKSNLKFEYLPVTEYNGEVAGDMIFEAIKSSVMLQETNAFHLLDVAHKISVTTLAETGLISVPYSCTFTGGDIVTTDVVLEPQYFSVDKNLCINTLWSTWYANKKRQGVENIDPAMSEFLGYVTAFYLKKVAGDVDNLIWNADTGSVTPTLAVFDGLIRTALNDVTVIDVPAVALTSANILSKLEAIITATPSEVLSMPDFKIYMNQKTASLYQIALTTAGSYLMSPTTAPQLSYLSQSIVVVPSMPNDTIYCTFAGNIAVGMDLTSLENTVKVIDMRSTTGDDVIRFRLRYNLDATHLFGKNVVLYTTIV